MPPLPKRKVSKRRGANRISHWLLRPKQVYVTCPSCGKPTLPHHVCPMCGKYHGKTVIEIEEEK